MPRLPDGGWLLDDREVSEPIYGRRPREGYPEFNPDQPRDEGGQWTSGGDDLPAETGTTAAPFGGANATDAERRAAKADVVNHVAAVLERDGPANLDLFGISRGPRNPQERAADAKRTAQGIIDSWAETSGDHSEYAIAIQRVAEREFRITGAESPIPSAQIEFGGNVVNAKATEIIRDHGETIRVALRAMYDRTQGELKAKGIESVTLYRGMVLGDDAPRGTGLDAVRLRPLSSFSSSKILAARFASTPGSNTARLTTGVLIAAKVPARAILSTAHTGFGCLVESEAVVLGGVRRVVYSARPMAGATFENLMGPLDDAVATMRRGQ